jgi:hypothetical protein
LGVQRVDDELRGAGEALEEAAACQADGMRLMRIFLFSPVVPWGAR